MTLSTLEERPEGQPRAVAALKAALKSGALHHAYLFTGPKGAGKERTALAFAQALLCPERPDEGCGACSACARVEKLSHPDLPTVMPEALQVERGLKGRSDFDHVPSREIRVEQIRQLQERLAFHALEAPRKVALLLRADDMNPQAQNAFLKTLEEPPAQTTLLLLAASPDHLLPTLRSRCSRIQLVPQPRVYDPAETRGTRAQLFEAFEGAREEDVRTVLRFAEGVGGSREEAEEALTLLGTWIRDLTVLKAGLEAVLHRDLVATAQRAATRYSEGALHRCQALLQEALTAISERNGSPRLQLERMMLKVCEVRR